mmetsp:Transcript_149882/g.481564  ORF Transcript_149882/g.481564 Transcript_149882/m.481564 type:complete len:515 (-) Transcript_149882:155-1699(-)
MAGGAGGAAPPSLAWGTAFAPALGSSSWELRCLPRTGCTVARPHVGAVSAAATHHRRAQSSAGSSSAGSAGTSFPSVLALASAAVAATALCRPRQGRRRAARRASERDEKIEQAQKDYPWLQQAMQRPQRRKRVDPDAPSSLDTGNMDPLSSYLGSNGGLWRRPDKTQVKPKEAYDAEAEAERAVWRARFMKNLSPDAKVAVDLAQSLLPPELQSALDRAGPGGETTVDPNAWYTTGDTNPDDRRFNIQIGAAPDAPVQSSASKTGYFDMLMASAAPSNATSSQKAPQEEDATSEYLGDAMGHWKGSAAKVSGGGGMGGSGSWGSLMASGATQGQEKKETIEELKDRMRKKRAALEKDNVITFADLQGNNIGTGGQAPTLPQKETKPEVAAIDPKEFEALLAMTSVERADIIEEITRKAFVLMDAGDIDEAAQQLKRATRMGETFQQLAENEGWIRKRVAKSERPALEFEMETPMGKISQEDMVIYNFRKQLHKEDFSGVFGAGGRQSRWIGGF